MAGIEKLNHRPLGRRVFLTSATASIIAISSFSGEASAKPYHARKYKSHQLVFVSPLLPADTQPTPVPTPAPSQSEAVMPTVNSKPPYYLEKFFIAVNYKIAQIARVNPAKVQTREHLIAETTQAISEGGDINNPSRFNPDNTGLYAPRLTKGKTSASGTQSFISFEAGVLATAITMTKPQYSRLEECLTNPNCTAANYISDLVYYQDFPGNALWASADYAGNPARQRQHYNELKTDLDSVDSNPGFYASIEIGTPKYEEPDDLHVPVSSLQILNPNQNTSTVTSTPNTYVQTTPMPQITSQQPVFVSPLPAALHKIK